MSNEKNFVKINVNLTLKEEEAIFFELLQKSSEKELLINDLIGFIFRVGLIFIHGQFTGQLFTKLFSPSTYITKLCSEAVDRTIKSEVKNTETELDRAFLDGEPAEFEIINNGDILRIRSFSCNSSTILNSSNSSCAIKNRSIISSISSNISSKINR